MMTLKWENAQKVPGTLAAANRILGLACAQHGACIQFLHKPTEQEGIRKQTGKLK